jgi:nucleoside-diphosphate-sugar epimerase
MRITIIALGWLGSKLYKYWEDKGHEVYGSYFSRPKGLNDFYFDISENKIPKEIESAQVIFFNLTPSGIGSLKNLESFLGKVSNKKFIFISSTSVYGPQGMVDELTKPLPDTQSGQFLLECEQLVKILCPNHLIIRPAGLYGEDRHPGKYLSGADNISNPDHPVNLVGEDDLIKLIDNSFERKEISLLNAVNTHHPSKKEYYQGYCKKMGLAIPSFRNDSDIPFKIVKTIHEEFEISSILA